MLALDGLPSGAFTEHAQRSAPELHALTSVAEVYAVVVPAVAKTCDDITHLQTDRRGADQDGARPVNGNRTSPACCPRDRP
jgi:hypothetical protein